MIRTGLIGYGRNGRSMHATAIEASPEFSMSAVCDIDRAALEAAGRRFGCALYEDYREMLAREALDLVVIVTPSDLHSQMSCDALRAGKNVLVTKPWGRDMHEVRSMLDAQKESGRLLMPWLPARWGSDLTRLRQIVSDGEIGEIFQIVRSQFTFGLRNDWQIYAERGGGYLLNWGPHLVDQPMQLLGARPTEIFAVMKQVLNPGTAEDVFYTVMQMENGVTVTVQYNIATPGMPNWILRGTRGTITMYDNKLRVERVSFPEHIPENTMRSKFTVDAREETVPGSVFGDTDEVYRHIADAVAHRAPYAIPLESAANLSRTLAAIRESAAVGRSVPLHFE